jgi:uncharacterized protein (TIGR02145 family)
MIDGITLEAYINELQEAADAASGDTVFIPSIIPGSAKGQMLFWGGTAWELLDPGEPGEMLQVGDDAMPRWEVPSPEACVVGCQDASACNYNALAKVTFVGACDYVSCLGCTDSLYLEFDPEATQDDGSCQILTVPGCTDAAYLEFNPDANLDDSTCVTLIIEGCMDSTYLEFNPEANVDDGSCQIIAIPGCTDDLAMNYDYTANLDDGSCIPYFYEGCGNVEAVDFEGYSYELITIAGRCWFAENLRTAHYSNGDPIPSGPVESWVSGEMGLQTTYAAMPVGCEGNCNPDSNLSTYGRIYNGYAVLDGRGLCPIGFEVASDSMWTDLEVLLQANSGIKLKASVADPISWDGSNASGMTALPGGYYDAWYNEYQDEGFAAEYWSLEPMSAWLRRRVESGVNGFYRYNAFSLSNGRQVRCVHIEQDSSCFDLDQDGVCAVDEIGGCTDPESPSFNSAATEDDGSCKQYGCDGIGSVNYQGDDYEVIEVGGQCWFAENLKSLHYADGSIIPGELTDEAWSNTTSGAQAIYGEGSSYCEGECNELLNINHYGRLYNSFAVSDSRGLCPPNWHVPSDADWLTLEMELGMTGQLDPESWRGSDQGAQMKSTSSDFPSWNGTNLIGFSADAGGWRGDNNGAFGGQGYYGYWWSSSNSNSTTGLFRGLSTAEAGVYRGYADRQYGLSVRCVKD